jgi:hypothetical protein
MEAGFFYFPETDGEMAATKGEQSVINNVVTS